MNILLIFILIIFLVLCCRSLYLGSNRHSCKKGLHKPVKEYGYRPPSKGTIDEITHPYGLIKIHCQRCKTQINP